MVHAQIDFSPFPSAVPLYDALVNKCLDQRQQPKQGVKCPALAAHATCAGSFSFFKGCLLVAHKGEAMLVRVCGTCLHLSRVV